MLTSLMGMLHKKVVAVVDMVGAFYRSIYSSCILLCFETLILGIYDMV